MRANLNSDSGSRRSAGVARGDSGLRSRHWFASEARGDCERRARGLHWGSGAASGPTRGFMRHLVIHGESPRAVV